MCFCLFDMHLVIDFLLCILQIFDVLQFMWKKYKLKKDPPLLSVWFAFYTNLGFSGFTSKWVYTLCLLFYRFSFLLLNILWFLVFDFLFIKQVYQESIAATCNLDGPKVKSAHPGSGWFRWPNYSDVDQRRGAEMATEWCS